MDYKHSLTELQARWIGSEYQHILCRGGRTGRKVHTAIAGSSTLGCGQWIKTDAARFRVSVAQADKMERCEKCFNDHFQERI